jgi:signal transduction histidine kinase
VIATENTYLPEKREDKELKNPIAILPDMDNCQHKGHFVRLTVTDTGTGMDEETKQKMFEPFFSTKKQGKGIGLGLSFVYGTVKQHGGWIDISSSKAKGTSVNIYLPACEPNAANDKSLLSAPTNHI